MLARSTEDKVCHKLTKSGSSVPNMVVGGALAKTDSVLRYSTLDSEAREVAPLLCRTDCCEISSSCLESAHFDWAKRSRKLIPWFRGGAELVIDVDGLQRRS